MIQSYSSITRYGFYWDGKTIGCPHSYNLRYNLKIEPTTVDSKAGRFGSIIHKILEDFYDAVDFSSVPIPPKEYFLATLTNLLTNQWDYSLSETQYKDANEILNTFAATESLKYMKYMSGEITAFKPLHRELKLTNSFNIRIDKVLNDHSLMDYKTSKELPNWESDNDIPIHLRLQSGIYGISYNRQYGIWPSRMIFYFLRHNQPRIVPINSQTIDITNKIVKSVTENINEGRFPKNSESCKWCDMRHVCGLEELDTVF